MQNYLDEGLKHQWQLDLPKLNLCY
jgi:hypothetical protein